MDLNNVDKKNRIKALEQKRFCLRDKIKAKLDKGLDKSYVKDDVITFNELIKELSTLGVSACIRSDYLKLENYKNIESKQLNSQVKKPKPFTETVIRKKSILKNPENVESKDSSDKIDKNNYYILNLAWTEKTQGDIDYTYITNIINNYFKRIGLKLITHELTNIGSTIEDHIMKYEIYGDDEYFKLIKLSAQYLLDFLNKNNYDIAIYGKKRNY